MFGGRKCDTQCRLVACTLSAVTSLSEFFGDESPLKALLPGFQPRAGQAWMAEAVADAIATSDKVAIEAGTGTGKTFAYLLPALVSGRKTIISTGTKALQDQLYHRDLPLIGKAVGRPVSTALLKGRANYLCLHRLDQLDDIAPSLIGDYTEVREWRHHTESGDRAELTAVAEDSAIWPLVTSTSDNCLGQHCPNYSECHVVKARRRAQEADLVVVNHHLLLADLAMKESGFVEFLPDAEAVILDEAHQVPDLAVQFFGVAVGSRELLRVVDEIPGWFKNLPEEERAKTVADIEFGFLDGKLYLFQIRPFVESKGAARSQYLQSLDVGLAAAGEVTVDLRERPTG